MQGLTRLSRNFWVAIIVILVSCKRQTSFGGLGCEVMQESGKCQSIQMRSTYDFHVFVGWHVVL